MKQRNLIMLAVVLITIVPFIVFAWFAYSFGKTTFTQFLKDRVVAINELYASKVLNRFDTIKDDLHTFTDSITVKTKAAEVVASLHAVNTDRYQQARTAMVLDLAAITDISAYEDVTILTPQGDVAMATSPRNQDQVGTKASGDLYTIFREGQKGFAVSQVIQDQEKTNAFVLSFANPIRDADERVIAIAVFVTRMDDFFADLKESWMISETGESSIGTDDGSSVLFLSPLRHDENAPLTRRVAFGDQKAAAMQQAVRGDSGFGETRDYHGTKVIAAWKYLASPNWGIVTKIDRSEAYQHVENIKHMLVYVIIALLLFVALAVYLLTEKLIIAPARAIAEVVSEMAEGREPVFDKKQLYRHDLVGGIMTHLYNIANKLKHHDHGGELNDLTKHEHEKHE